MNHNLQIRLSGSLEMSFHHTDSVEYVYVFAGLILSSQSIAKVVKYYLGLHVHQSQPLIHVEELLIVLTEEK